MWYLSLCERSAGVWRFCHWLGSGAAGAGAGAVASDRHGRDRGTYHRVSCVAARSLLWCCLLPAAANTAAAAASRRGLRLSTLSSQTWRCSRVTSRTSAIFGEGRKEWA